MINAGPRMPRGTRGRKPGARSMRRTDARVSPSFREALLEILRQAAKNPALLRVRPMNPNPVISRVERKRRGSARRAGKR